MLLVDEVDRADDEFEAFLLEVLSDYTVTVPELGTIRAEVPPVVVVTSNRTREVHDALKRRCLYHWVEHPSFDREVAIVRARVPEASAELAAQVAHAVATLRGEDLLKPPGVAETIDWTQALVALGAQRLDAGTATATLGAVLKYREDQLHAVAPRRAADDRDGGAGPVTGAPYDAVDSLVGLAATLRGAGVAASTDRVHAAVSALALLDPVRRSDAYWAGRLTLCGSREDLDRYDAVFAAYFGDRPGTLVRRQRIAQSAAAPGRRRRRAAARRARAAATP